jgi:hypothetical protein
MSVKGSVPAHAYYGQPVYGQRLASVDGARLAAPSGPYIGRGNKCAANDDTCEGMKAKGTDYCMGHLRSILKEEGVDKVEEVTDGVQHDDSDAVA